MAFHSKAGHAWLRRLLFLLVVACANPVYAEQVLFAGGFEFCGDGRVTDPLQCDDGNIASGDGCGIQCQVEFGWQCTGSPSQCSVTGTIADMSFGLNSGCLRLTDGQLGCFGDNATGEVGNGGGPDVFVPVPVLEGVSRSVSGIGHQCALMVDGSVRCFGLNSSLQLGGDASGNTPRPLAVPGIANATAIDAGNAHTCVIVQGGSVWCWGENNNLQLGRGSDPTDSAVPQAVTLPAGRTAVSLGLGGFHSCAVLDDANVACWGDDAQGQLGDGAAGVDSGTPTLVAGLVDVVQVEGGSFSTCTRASVGAVHCFGDNVNGQLGIGGGGDQALPQLVSALPPSAELALGEAFACSLSTGGALHCFGRGLDYRTASGNVIDLPSPQQVPLPSATWNGLEAGVRGFCLRSAQLGRHCVGFSESGAFGVGPRSQLEPLPLLDLPAQVRQLAITETSFRGVLCAVGTDGRVRCSGNGSIAAASPTTGAEGLFGPIKEHLPLLTPMTFLGGVQQLALGSNFACYRSTSDVRCYGTNSSLQLGQGGGTTPPNALPLVVPGLAAVDEISAGIAFTCVRIGTEVKCWGENSQLQSGGATTADVPVPSDVDGDGDIVAISTGGTFACAVRSAGTVACWGDDAQGQLGDNDGNPADSASMVAVTGLPPDVTQVGTGQLHACALAAGQVYCWGDAMYGNLGQGNTIDSDTALAVPGLAGIVRIAVGHNYSCALDAAGDLRCWGYSLDGHLGDGGQILTGLDRRTSPTLFALAANIEEVLVGNGSTCVRVAGQWRCLGFVASGQLGNDTTVTPSRPHPVAGGL